MYNKRIRLEKGDLVQWHEYYADGDIVRDGGTGIIISDPIEPRVAPHRVHRVYEGIYRIKVFCTKKRAARWFNLSEIDLIKKGAYVPNNNNNNKREK